MFGRGIILVLAISILLLGCCAVPGGGPTGETGGISGGGAGTTGGETGGTGTTGGETGGTGTTGGQTGGTGSTDGGTGTDGGQGGNDLADKTYEQLVGMGIPMQCDITMTYGGQTTHVKVYMKNQDEVRDEIPLEEAGSICSKMVTILKGNTIYSGCEGEKYPPGTSCDWMKFVMTDTESDGGTTEPPDYSDVPPTQINCVPWVPDESKFATPGKICTQEDIVNEMMNQYNYD